MMTWPFENDTSAVVKKLAKRSLASEKRHPEIRAFDYSWSIVNDPQKAERVESALEEILSSRSNLGLDTIGAHIEYEKMQNSLIFGGMRAISWLIFLFGVVNLILEFLLSAWTVGRQQKQSLMEQMRAGR